MSKETHYGTPISVATCTVVLLLGTAFLLPYLGTYQVIVRMLSLQICIPVLFFCLLRYLWNFGLIDSTNSAAKGRRFSSLNPKTQIWLRALLRVSSITVGLIFIIWILVPLEIAATKLLLSKGTPWEIARVTAIDAKGFSFILHERLTISTTDGQIKELDFFLPGKFVKPGSSHAFLILPGTSLIVGLE